MFDMKTLYLDMPLTAHATWNVFSTTAFGEEEISPCVDVGVFAAIVVGGGVGAVGDALFTLGPVSKFTENPSAMPSIQTAAKAQIHL